MLETNDLVLLGILTGFVSVLITVFGVWIAFSIRSRDVNEAYRRIESLEASVRGQISGNRRAERSERMQSAMLEAAAIMKNPEVADKQKAIMELALKYPDIAMDLIKKGI